MFTVDASVWVNYASPAEPGHDASRAFIRTARSRGEKIIVPTLLLPEVVGAISRVRNDTKLGEIIGKRIIALPMIRWVDLDLELAQRAAQLAATHRVRGADAVYAAVALSHGCDLVSLDHEHLTRLPSVLTTLTPADALARLG